MIPERCADLFSDRVRKVYSRGVTSPAQRWQISWCFQGRCKVKEKENKKSHFKERSDELEEYEEKQ